MIILKTTYLVSPKCPGSLCQGPRVSCHEKTLCFENVEDLVPEVALLQERVSVLLCCVANGTPSMNTFLEGGP